MKKIFIALMIALIVTSSSLVEAAEFTGEQFNQMFTITAKNPAVNQNKTLKFNDETFRKNFNAFMINFIKQTNAGDDAAMIEKFLLIDGTAASPKGDYFVFGKNFGGKVVIIGLSEIGKNFKVLNFFAAKIENRDDALFYTLILNGFVKSISPDLDADTLLNKLKKNSVVIRGGVKFSVTKSGDIDIITATAN